MINGNSENSGKPAAIVNRHLQLYPQWVFKYLSHSGSHIVHDPSTVNKVLIRYPPLCLGLCSEKLHFFFWVSKQAITKATGKDRRSQYHMAPHPHKSWGAQGGARKRNGNKNCRLTMCPGLGKVWITHVSYSPFAVKKCTPEVAKEDLLWLTKRGFRRLQSGCWA